MITNHNTIIIPTEAFKMKKKRALLIFKPIEENDDWLWEVISKSGSKSYIYYVIKKDLQSHIIYHINIGYEVIE